MEDENVLRIGDVNNENNIGLPKYYQNNYDEYNYNQLIGISKPIEPFIVTPNPSIQLINLGQIHTITLVKQLDDWKKQDVSHLKPSEQEAFALFIKQGEEILDKLTNIYHQRDEETAKKGKRIKLKL